MSIHPLSSLRWRLGIGVIGILLFGVVSADLATYVVVRGLYEQRITESLDIISSRILAAEGNEGEAGYASSSQSIVITDPYIAFYSTDGRRVSERVPIFPGGQSAPDVPGPDVIGSETLDVVTPGQSNGLVVRAQSLSPQEQFEFVIDGETVTVDSLVIGLTSARATETFDEFVRAQVIVGLIILALAIGGAVVLLRIGLRPLVRVARTAEAIGAGNLTQRIPIDDPDSEIGLVSNALNDAFDKVEQSEIRMRGFVADASHELRTPLSTIRGWADLYLSNGIREWEDVDIAMTRIRSESDRLGDLVEQLLSLARLDAQVERQVQAVNLAELVTEIVQLMSVATRDHRVTSKISPEAALLQEIPSDEMLLRQILMNLMSNASRHTPPGTTVELSLDVEQESSHVLLCVSDDGPGMTPDELAHAYDRFWRAEPGRGPTGGTGLGLAIVRSSVLALGGTIVMESLPGSGLAVTIRLPVVDRSIQ